MPTRVTITTEALIPDLLKLERFRRTPELGPKLLFFSGGTALTGVSRELINYTHNSIHIITPFDSGGSSAELRRAFAMPAVGDIRNRLMALADQSVKGTPEVFTLFAKRLDTEADQPELRQKLVEMSDGLHPLVRAVPGPMRMLIQNHFHRFLEAMPADFDLKGASIGNLVLTAGYLDNRQQMDSVIFLFSKLVQVCGLVSPVVGQNLHLAVELESGEVIVGQHRFTGKADRAIPSPIARIWLTAGLDTPEPVTACIDEKMKGLIGQAGLICYPMGSFYSSVIANLLPQGVGMRIASNRCPKVFVPNTLEDPEAPGMSVTDQVKILQETLTRCGARADEVLHYVLVDLKNGRYPNGCDQDELQRLGIKVIDCPLVAPNQGGHIQAQPLVQALLSLA
ncbi:MAG: GAK system CofD-like protein [Proteobacteria bacterium]|nr:GAK system CofD-like protein [Pseudomonadota bacterium]